MARRENTDMLVVIIYSYCSTTAHAGQIEQTDHILWALIV